MVAFSRTVQVAYVITLASALFLLLGAAKSQAQFGVSAGYRGTPALPTIAIPVFSGSGSASAGFGGIGGITGGSGSASASFSTQIVYVNLGSFFPNEGRLIGLPPAPLTPMLNNLFFAGLFFSPFTSDSTGAPWALLGAMSMGGGGMGMMGMMGMGGMGMMGMGGMRGMMGMGGMGMMGMGGMGMMGMGGMGMRGFAGKGLGGFNGCRAL